MRLFKNVWFPEPVKPKCIIILITILRIIDCNKKKLSVDFEYLAYIIYI